MLAMGGQRLQGPALEEAGRAGHGDATVVAAWH